MPGFGEALPEARLAAEDQGEGAAPVELVGGEQAKVLQGLIGEEMRLVDDQDLRRGRLRRWPRRAAAVSPLKRLGLQPEGGGDVGDQAERAQGGEGEGDELVAGGVQGLGEQGQGRGLAAAAVGHEQGDGVPLQGEVQPGDDLLQALVAEDGLLGGDPWEGLLGEAEVLLEGRHGWSPFGDGEGSRGTGPDEVVFQNLEVFAQVEAGAEPAPGAFEGLARLVRIQGLHAAPERRRAAALRHP